MEYWLFKSEPNTWSWDDQVKKGDEGEGWDGVRNYQAPLGLDSGILSLAAARKLGLAVIDVSQDDPAPDLLPVTE